MVHVPWVCVHFVALWFALMLSSHVWAWSIGTDLRESFVREVDRRLETPEHEQIYYSALIAGALAAEKLDLTAPQYILLVDRSRWVQAALLFWMSADKRYHFIGASPVTTGLPGRYDYFATPLGVFDHSLDNPDFRAEGTRNKLGILGYGEKGMRVYDFGWIRTRRGWGPPGESFMRLQLHATDPLLLEPKLGKRSSKGCIRIPASLNLFLDRYGILDADYERALSEGEKLWILRSDRSPTPWPGRYLVVVDSQRSERPVWSPDPSKPASGRLRAPSGIVPP